MMDGEELYGAFKHAIIDAMAAGAGGKASLALPLTPFRANREIPLDEDNNLDPVNVVGLRFDPVSEEWKFVCVTFDGDGEVYTIELDAVKAEGLPGV